jgi:hypothetical protein
MFDIIFICFDFPPRARPDKQTIGHEKWDIAAFKGTGGRADKSSLGRAIANAQHVSLLHTSSLCKCRSMQLSLTARRFFIISIVVRDERLRGARKILSD